METDIIAYTELIIEKLKVYCTKHELHTFDSGAVMIDFCVHDEDYCIQLYDEKFGISHVSKGVDLSTVPDKIFTNWEAFYMELEQVINSEMILLRNNPVFKIILYNDCFKIINETDYHDNGDYVYESVSNLKLQHKGVNWFVTILNSIVSFFFVGIEGELWKDKDSLLFTYKDVKKRVLLTNCDMLKAEQLVKRIQNKIDKQLNDV